MATGLVRFARLSHPHSIDPFVLAGEVEAPVGLEVAVAHDGTELEDGLGSGEPSTGPGDVQPVGDQLAARTVHYPLAIGQPAFNAWS